MHRLMMVLGATAACALVASPAVAQTAEFRIAIVDSRAILGEAPGAAEAQAAFERDLARFQSELQQLEEELQSMVTRFQQQQAVMSAEARQREENAILQKQQELQTRVAELENEASQRQAELVGPIMERVSAAIEEFRRENGYALILDIAAGSIIAADPSLDVTEQVIARLRNTASNQ